MFSTLYSISFLFVVLFSEVAFVEQKIKLKKKSLFIYRNTFSYSQTESIY